MKKYIGTALTVCIVLSFIVLSIVWHGNAFTNDQMSTFKMLLIVCGCSIAYCFIVGEITRNYSQMPAIIMRLTTTVHAAPFFVLRRPLSVRAYFFFRFSPNIQAPSFLDAIFHVTA